MRFLRRLATAGIALAMSLLLLAGTVGGAMAARPEVITIEIDLDANVETFTTNSGVLCPSGVAYTDFHFGAGNFRTAGTFHLDKLMVCDDLSGSFTIRVDAASNFLVGQGTKGGWSVVPGSGSGAYVGLYGGGNVVGINSSVPPIDLTDHYFGHVDL